MASSGDHPEDQNPLPGFFRVDGRSNHWLNRKNIRVPLMGLVTVFCPLTTTGGGELVVQTADETKLVVDCKLNPA